MAGETILLVEDDLTTVKVLKKKLENEGYRVIVASDGKEGLKKGKKAMPPLILLDLLMPGMNGIQMLEALQKEAWAVNTNVIVLTNFGDAKQLKLAKDLGAYACLIKTDHSLDDIMQQIQGCLVKAGVIKS